MKASERRERLVAAMSQVASGDQDALATVYEQTSTKLFGLILRITRDREQAEDVLQDVYIKVWNRAGRYQADRASPITWLATIARNSAIDSIRRQKRRPTDGDDGIEEIEDGAISADEMLCIQQDFEAVTRCMEELNKNHRRSIRLAFFDGLTHSELAARVGVPLGTMKSWIRRGLAGLKGCLGYGR